MRSLSLVLIAFLILGIAYSIAVPIFEAPDELQHYATAEYIARFKWLPPLGKPAEHLWDQEALQAPLYYAIVGALTSWIDTSDFSRQVILQPKPNFGDAELPGKKNSFLHPADQSFPYHDTTLAVHVARWFSVLLGVGTIVLTFIASSFIFSPTAKFPNFLYLPSMFLAFIPQYIFIHASANNDTMITFTSTLTLVMLLWIGRDGVTTRRSILLGVAIGSMCLSKLMGTVLAVVAFVLFLALIWSAKPPTSRSVRGITLPFLITFFVAALISGWWYVRNQIIYGDLLALNAFLKFVGGNLSIGAVTPQFLWEQLRLLRFSTWGLFGHISLLLQPVWIYNIYDAVAVIGAIGFLFGVINALRSSRLRDFLSNHQSLIIIFLWFGAVLAVAARWFFAAGIQGRLIFPGLPAGIILMIWGLRFIAKRFVSEKILALSLMIPSMIFAAAVVPLYISPAYSPPPLVTTSPSNVNAIFADEIKLNGYTIAREGDLLKMTFYWETMKTPSFNYTVAIRLVRADRTFWLDYVNYPGMGTTFPTTWKVGEIRQDDYVFDTRRFTKEEKPLRLIVGFFDSRTRAMTSLTNWNDVREKDWATLTEIRIK